MSDLMTQSLQQAFNEVSKLSELEQNAIASIIFDELADEKLWQQRFANSQEKLSALAARAREQIQKGEVKAGGFDQL